MKIAAESPKAYIDSLPEERKKAISKLRNIILKNLPKGFKEIISYGMIGYVVPHSLYPEGYHCNPTQPLPFMNIASQKNHIAVYNMAICSPEILSWFKKEYPKYTKEKLNMGKSCIRFTKPDNIPYELIGQLASKMTPHEWIKFYKKVLKR